ncbi:MAG TPA: glycosyltransferase family 39 protein [Pyrinomonadaceae bacterium]|nr:glycosyltransferase family 39 protein [Pyrinomonadaceae bacterium]
MRHTYLIGMLLLITGLAAVGLSYPDGVNALLVAVVFSTIALASLRNQAEDKGFITNLFLAAFFVRLVFGLFIELYPDMRDFFGPDALTYHNNGQALAEYWLGSRPADDYVVQRATTIQLPGWGMNYLVGAIYLALGPSLFAAQSLCAVVGAATAPLVYFLANKIFLNKRVSRFSAIAIAFFPSFIIWSSQLMKDGLIIFLLVLAILMVMRLQEQFSWVTVIILIVSLLGILSLRFYIFYMVALAVTGSFLIGVSGTGQSIFRRTGLLVVIGLGLTYFGVINNASSDIENYGRLERVQRSRLGLQSAESGYGEELDVSTTSGALTAIPVGFAYLMLAPFPWQMANVRQAITLPEVLLWWAMIPLMVAGIWYALRNRLRSAFPILFFSLMLTLSYSIFLGNVGTAYRQRTQIQVFLFIFIAVGWELWRERREDRKAELRRKQQAFDERLRAGAQLNL